MSERVDVLAVLRSIAERASAYRWDQRGGVDSVNLLLLDERDQKAIVAVVELIEADHAFDEAESAMVRYHIAGPRHGGGYGTPWEARDEAIKRDLYVALKSAHERRAAALASVAP